MEPDPRIVQLMMALRRSGVTDRDVLNALERTPRDLFVPREFHEHAFDDKALPIECGQTISQPYVVARMTEALRVEARSKVLEIGTGSGYQAAVLSRLCRRVYTVERYRSLSRAAQERFDALGLSNIVTRIGDGAYGWPEQAPFDRILVTAAAEKRPDALLMQLREGGVCVAPVHVDETGMQAVMRYTAHADGFEEERLFDVRFVPLVSGERR
jgi:protein-L-isoaspartate(D-aspartate) O-methyltransferase